MRSRPVGKDDAEFVEDDVQRLLKLIEDARRLLIKLYTNIKAHYTLNISYQYYHSLIQSSTTTVNSQLEVWTNVCHI